MEPADLPDPHELRLTFDQAARLYDQARPGYPPQLFADIIAFSSLPSTGRILEIGCGTGQASLPFARRGYRLLCIELGPHLAAIARQNLAEYPLATVWTGAFEDWQVEPAAFDLAFSATAFHWLEPEIAFPKIAQALKRAGAIALFWNRHVHSDASGDFFERVQPIYRREAPELVKEEFLPPPADQIPETARQEIGNTGLFGPVTVHQYRWDFTYGADSYINVLSTYSGHLRLPPEKRRRLFQGIHDLIERQYAGRIVKGYLTILYLAHKISL